MQGIVLAAGKGTRLRPLTETKPKPLVEVGGKPLLSHSLKRLVSMGVDEIVVVVGYRRDRVQSYFGPSYRNVPLTYVTQEKQLGTGHAVLAAESAVDGTFLVINGDQIVDSRIVRDALEAHDSDDASATVALLQRSSVEGYGGVLVEDGEITAIVEDPRDDRDYLLNAGIYVLEPTVFDGIRAAKPRAGEHLLVDGLSELIESGEVVRGVVSEGIWVDATYPWDLLDVSFELFDMGLVDEDSTNVHGKVACHESAVIREPVVVDRDCVIEPGSVVGPYVCLGENATIGSNAVVKRSVIDSDTRIEANATVNDCVTGTGVTIGAGSNIPGGPGDVRVKDRVFEGEDLGALLADRVSDRGGVTYAPGTLVGPNADIHAGATVRGTIDAETEVRN